jgi:hypothetical protein
MPRAAVRFRLTLHLEQIRGMGRRLLPERRRYGLARGAFVGMNRPLALTCAERSEKRNDFVFLFLTWHIPSVASAMMAGAVHLSIADVYYPAMLAGRAGAAGLATAGALFTLGRLSTSKVREWSALHTGGRGGADGAAGGGGSPVRPNGGLPGTVGGPLTEASVVRATNGARSDTAAAGVAAGRTGAASSAADAGTAPAAAARATPPNTPTPPSETR